MPRPVDESWDRITAWLARHAPRAAARIGPPAGRAEIARAGAEVGVEPPPDLVAWWRRANGIAGPGQGPPFDLLPRHFPYTVEQALHSREIWLKVWRDDANERGWWAERDMAALQAAPAGTEAGMWLPGWLPIANSGGGQDLFVDLRPGPLHGCVREFDRVEADGKVLWGGVAAMLADLAQALESGSMTVGPYEVGVVVADDGALYWEDL
ncbi:SMI1/KNR4 family protein [Spirillospora sp. NPDC127200]